MKDSAWYRVGAIAGFTCVVLMILGGAIGGEPPQPDDSAETIRAYFADHRFAVLLSMYLSSIAFMALLLFAVAARNLLLRAETVGTPGSSEGSPGFMSTVFLVAVVVSVAVSAVQSVAYLTLAHRSAAYADEVLVALNDLSMVAGALAWLPIGLAALAAGLAGVSTRAIPAWVSVMGVVLGCLWVVFAFVILIAEEGVLNPVGPISLVAYLSLAVWVGSLSAVLLGRSRAATGSSSVVA